MTVRELIQELSNVNPDLPVYTAGDGWQWGPADSVSIQPRNEHGYPAGVWIQP